MAPRRSRAKRLHLLGVDRRLVAQPSPANRVAVASPAVPPPGATAPAAKPPTCVEPPLAACVKPEATSVEPGATAVAETPAAAAAAPDSTPASTLRTVEHTTEAQVLADVKAAPVATSASAAPAGKALTTAASVSAVPSVQSARAAISAHRRRLRAKRHATAALARKAKHHRNISAPQQAISLSKLFQPSAPARTSEMASTAAAGAPATEAAVKPISVAAQPNITQADFTASELTEPAAPTDVAPLPAPAPITIPHRATISRIPKKRKFFAELDDSVTAPTAEATPLAASSKRHLLTSDAAVAPRGAVEAGTAALPAREAPPHAPPVTPAAVVEEVTEKTSAVADDLPAPAAARRMATHRISKKPARGATGNPTNSSGTLLPAETTLEATLAAAAAASVTKKAPVFNAATLTMPETSAVPTPPVVAAPLVELPQRSAPSTPPLTAPEMTSAATVASMGRATMSRISKKRKRFFAELDDPPASDATLPIQETLTVPADLSAAVTLNDTGTAATIAVVEPTAPTVEAAAAPPAAAVAVAEAVLAKPTATQGMVRRRSRRRGRLPPRTAVEEALTATEKLPSESTASTLATPIAEATLAAVTESVQGAEVAAPAESAGETVATTEAVPPVEAVAPPAAVRKRGHSKPQSSKVKRLTAAAIRRRELAAYNRIPKRFRPPVAPRLVFPTPATEQEGATALTDASAATSVVGAVEVTETPQPAAVSTAQTESVKAVPEMCTERKTTAAVEAIADPPAAEASQPPPGASTAWGAAAAELAECLTETTKSTALPTASVEEQRLVGHGRGAPKSRRMRMTPSPKKRFFTTLEEVPTANLSRVEAAAVTETTAAAVEVQPAVPQSHADVAAIHSSLQVAGDDTMVDADLTAVAEETAAPQSALNTGSEAASATAAVEEASTEAPQPMADQQPTATTSAEETPFEAVNAFCIGDAAPASEAAAAHAQPPAPAQRKVIRFTNVRDMLKAIRKAKQAGKRGSAKKRLCGKSSLPLLATTVTDAVDEVVSAEASSSAAEATPSAEEVGAEIGAPPPHEVEAMTAVAKTDAPAATEQQTVGEAAPAAEVEVEMNVEATTTTATPEVTEACSTAPVNKEAVQSPETQPCAEFLMSPAQAAVAAPAEDLPPVASSSPSPARRQAAKQKIKKHAKLAAARLNKHPTYTVSAAIPLATDYTPAETMDAPLVEAVHSAAEPFAPPAEEASAATLVRHASLMLPSGRVVMESFTDDEMVLRRTTLDDSWDVGLRFDWQERTLTISSFPTFEEADKRAAHPFVQRFKSRPRWLLMEVNEASAAHMKRALDSMNRSLTARFVFRHLR
ncbi:hypothetical protein, conserved [Leishmania lindenbergi]|uniref:DUF7759 domain-containing protein n=1 Tax=Leishmania lindenbergi TaxID=651832 RepID=A0AAW3A4L2_9TRYP